MQMTQLQAQVVNTRGGPLRYLDDDADACLDASRRTLREVLDCSSRVELCRRTSERPSNIHVRHQQYHEDLNPRAPVPYPATDAPFQVPKRAAQSRTAVRRTSYPPRHALPSHAHERACAPSHAGPGVRLPADVHHNNPTCTPRAPRRARGVHPRPITARPSEAGWFELAGQSAVLTIQLDGPPSL